MALESSLTISLEILVKYSLCVWRLVYLFVFVSYLVAYFLLGMFVWFARGRYRFGLRSHMQEISRGSIQRFPQRTSESHYFDYYASVVVLW